MSLFSFLGFGGATTESSPPPSQGMTTAQLQRAAITKPSKSIALGGGLPALNWGSIQGVIGSAQNLTNGASQNSGGSFATSASNIASEFLGGNAAKGAAGLFTDDKGNPSSPIMGLVSGGLGALTYSLVSGATRESVFGTAISAGSNLNLKSVQNFLGQAQSVTHKLTDTFGFLFPSASDYNEVSLLARVKPLGSDSNIKYSVAPFIPTLSGHEVSWQRNGEGTDAISQIKKSHAVASRMSFRLDGRNTVMSLLVGPKQVGIARSQVISNSVSRTGFIVNPTGPGEFDVSVSGTTAGFYEQGGLTTRETKTVAYSNLLLLYNFFLNNGYILDDETSAKQSDDPNMPIKSVYSPPDFSDDSPVRRINSMSYVAIEWQKWVWWGYFKSFKISDIADAPYTLNYDFTFRVCHETDLFKIDNLRGDSRQTPKVTGHVTKGYSPERALASKVLGGKPPANLEDPNPKHKNVMMSNFMFDDDTSPLSALDQRVSLDQAAYRLSIAGYSLNFQSGPQGMRFFGQNPDGVGIDLCGRANERSLTINNPGASPVRYINTATQSSDVSGNPVIYGVVKAGPDGISSSYTQEGTLADPPNNI